MIFVASLIAMYEFFAMTLPAEDRRPALVMGGLACLAFYWLDALALAPYGNHIPIELQRLAFGGGSTVALMLAVVVPGLFFLFRFRDIPTVANRLIHDGERRLRALTGTLTTRVIPESTWRTLDPNGLTLRDIDTPADLA